MFQVRYTPLLKFEIVSVSSTAFPFAGSMIVIVCVRPFKSQSIAYSETWCDTPAVMFRLKVKPLMLLVYHVAAVRPAPTLVSGALGSVLTCCHAYVVAPVSVKVA
jgi:hypothetical protein